LRVRLDPTLSGAPLQGNYKISGPESLNHIWDINWNEKMFSISYVFLTLFFPFEEKPQEPF